MKLVRPLWFALFLILIFSNSIVTAEAYMLQKGEVHIRFEDIDNWQDFENIFFCITKIGDINDGVYEIYPQYAIEKNSIKSETKAANLSDFLDELVLDMKPDFRKAMESKSELIFDNLEEGIYVVYSDDENASLDIEPSLITIPMNNEMDGTMEYKIDIIPKFSKKVLTAEVVPQTGDKTNLGGTVVLGAISIVLVVITGKLIAKKCRIN